MREANKEEIFVAKKALKLKDGTVIKSIPDLLEALKKINEATFKSHVNGKNDFSDWVLKQTQLKDLAACLSRRKTRNEMIEVLEKIVKAKEFVFETIIIGGGIAGVAAAVYAARQRMDFLLIADNIGGEALFAGEIENYPAIKKTDGFEFAKMLEDQLNYNNVNVLLAKVQKIERFEDHFRVFTDKGDFLSETIIICTGSRHRELNVPGEKEFAKKGVTYCAVCDAPLFKNKVVAVIGGGDAGAEAVQLLLRIANHIYWINRGAELKAKPYLQESILRSEKVTLINNANTMEIFGDTMVKGLKYVDLVTNETKTLNVDGIFVQTGLIPNTEFVKDLLALDKDGHIIVDKFGATSVEGVWAAGDCTDIKAYQFVTAAGQAVTALLYAYRYLQKKRCFVYCK